MEVKTVIKRICFVVLTLIISAIVQLIMVSAGVTDDVRHAIMVPITTIGLSVSMNL